MTSRRIAAVGATVVMVLGVTWAVAQHSRDVGADGVADRSVVVVNTSAQVAPGEPVPVLAWGPSVIDMARAEADAAALPLDVAAGSIIVAGWNSPDPAAAAALVRDSHLAGLILMGGAIVDGDQVRTLTAAVAAVSAEDGSEWPAVISTDQEGGPVSRLEGLVPGLPAFMAAGSSQDKALVADAYAAAGRDMTGLGFTVDWAPVADVTVGLDDPVIRVRSAGADPANVATTVVAAVKGFLDGGIVPAVKHFPGHGSVTTDSHAALPLQQATVATLAERDLVPFAAAIDAGAPMVMMAHVEVGEWGSGPVTTSPQAYAYLRDELGFTGVAVTDALNMAAIVDAYAPGDSEVAALAAGADLLLMPRDVEVARQAIVAAVTSGALSRERLDEAVARVSLMMTMQQDVADLAVGEVPAARDYARRFAGTSATVAAPTCGGRLVGDSVEISGGWPSERAALADALAAHGVGLGGGTTIQLLGSASSAGSADVVVAMDGPWGLASSSASVYVGLYGRSPDALAGLADVLVGAVAPQGQWAVPGLPTACL